MKRRDALKTHGFTGDTIKITYRNAYAAGLAKGKPPSYRDYASADLALQKWLDEEVEVTTTVEY